MVELERGNSDFADLDSGDSERGGGAKVGPVKVALMPPTLVQLTGNMVVI